MKQILVMMAAVVLVGCSNETPETSQAAEAEPQVRSQRLSQRQFLQRMRSSLQNPFLRKQFVRNLGNRKANSPRRIWQKSLHLNMKIKLQNKAFLNYPNYRRNLCLEEMAKLQKLEPGFYLEYTINHRRRSQGRGQVADAQTLG